jgi:hypothetical protein
MPTPKLTTEILNAAIDGYEAQKTRIDTQIAELRAMLSGAPAATAATPEAPARKRKKFSATTRKRMKEAQRLRWAKIRGESAPPAPAKAPKAKRKLSAAGRKAISEASKKRWRLQKAAAKAQSTPAKKAAPARKKSAA